MRLPFQFTKRSLLVSSVAFLVVVILVSGLFWYVRSPILSIEGNTGDDVQEALELAVLVLSNDVGYWYKANIILTIILASSGVCTTILASITIKDNLDSLKKYTISFAATTSLIIAIQGTFHIHDNLAAFVDAKVDLSNVYYQYVHDKSQVAVANQGAAAVYEKQIAMNDLQITALRDLERVMKRRLLAYAAIGRQPPTASGLPTPPSPPPPKN